MISLDNENDIMTGLPEYEEENPPFQSAGNYVSFAANKEEIYRRNRLIAAEEQAKLLAAEQKKKEEETARREAYEAQRKAYDADLVRGYPPAQGTAAQQHSPARIKKELMIVAAIALLITSAFIYAGKSSSDNNEAVSSSDINSMVQAAVEDVQKYTTPITAEDIIAQCLSIDIAPLQSERIIDSEAAAAGLPAEYRLYFWISVTNTSGAKIRFNRNDFLLKSGYSYKTAPYEITEMYGEETLEKDDSLEYMASFIISGDKIGQITGFYYENSEGDSGTPDFEYAFDEESIELIREYVSEADSDYESIMSLGVPAAEELSPAEEQPAGEGSAAEEAKVLPSPLSEKAGSYVYTTDKLSLRFTAEKEPVYVDNELFTYIVQINVEARNLTYEEQWLFAGNFYFSDGSKKNFINTQYGYSENTTYFSAWQSVGDSDEKIRKPIAFGFDENGSCSFELIGYISADNAESFGIFGYDSENGWASAKSDMKSIEGLEFSLDKLIK